jgi:D-aminopeptidase
MLRDHGLHIGELATGPANTIADAGVRVGHVTVGRTGVTALVPPRLPTPAGVAVLNGAGELTGSLQIREWGLLETPVYLTATMAVGRVYDGAVAAAMAADPRVGVDDVVIPVVGECDDSWLSDPRAFDVESEHVAQAVDAAGAVSQGAVGAGAGMVCFGWKGGIGSASRVVGSGAVVGALVLANFGTSRQLRIDGVPVGRALPTPSSERGPAGSCIAVLATDAALPAADLERLARRAGLGLARTGSVAHHGSGEIFLAMSTGDAAAQLDDLFAAAVDATEEAVLNALWSAETTTGREGRVVEALPHEPVLDLLQRAGRLAG